MDLTDPTELEHMQMELYVKAYKAGHSVLTIGRCLGFSNMNQIYRILRDVGAVPHISKRQRFNIPPQLESAFKKSQFSFAQWCNSWGFSVQTAEKAIEIGHWDVEKPEHKKALAALNHDFVNLYMDLYNIGNIFDRKYPADRVYPKLSLMVTWDEELDGYIATIPERPGIKGIGKTWDTAQTDMKRLYNAQRRIQKLQDLIEKKPDGNAKRSR